MSSLVQGWGGLVVKIWRSGDPEMRKRVADVFWKQSRRRRFFQGVCLLGVIARKAVWEKGGGGDSGRGQVESWGG